MNKNRTPRKLHSAGATHASAATKAEVRDAQILGQDGKPLYTGEEFRVIKLMEAKQERERLNRLLADANKRFFEERKYRF